MRTTQRTRISSTDFRVGDTFRKRRQTKVGTQFHCRLLRRSRGLRVLQCRWNCRRAPWSDNKDSKDRNYNSTNSQITYRFWCGKSIQNSSRKQCCGSKKWRWSIHERNWSHRDPFLERIFQISRCRTRRLLLALNKIIQNSQFKKKVNFEEQKAQKEGWFLRGRQIAFMIYDYFRVLGAHDTVLDYADLFSVNLHDDNMQEFDTRRDEVLLSMSKIPSDDILGRLYKLRIRESDPLKIVLELYDMEIHQKISVPNYQKLKTMLRRGQDQKLRLRNFDAKHGRIETREVVKNRKDQVTLEGKGTCYQWMEKGQCSKGDQCSFRHESSDRARKPVHNAATPSGPSLSQSRSVSKKRSIRSKSNHGATLRQPCRSYLKGTCTRSPFWLLASSRVSIL